MRSKQFWIGCGMALGAVLTSTAGATPRPPDVDPADFVYPITEPNPFFPLVPGTTFFYEGEKEGIPTTDVTEVTCDTLVIEGVVTTIVHDQAFEDGLLVEDTFDYYAQGHDGTVWYFGEDSMEVPSGSTEGSWRAGVDDAAAGVIMLADPQPRDHYYQEFARNTAEDQAKVLTLDGSACVPYGELDFCSDHLLVTKETSRLDPGVAEEKYYAAGIGFLRGEAVKKEDEQTALVDITLGPCRP
jgi:hypothetical protein